MTELPEITIVTGYGLLVFLVGAFFTHRQSSSETFFLADRTLGRLHVFAATFSTFYGTGIVFTFAAFGYLYGVGAFVLPIAAVVGFAPLAWAAPRIKKLSDRRDAITLPGLMRGDWSNPTRVLGALVTVGLYTAALAVNILVVGTVLESLFGVPFQAGIVAFGLLVVLYTTLGGFRGVVWTDVLQFVLIVLSIVVLLPVLVVTAPGRDVMTAIPASHLDPFSLPLAIPVVYLFTGVFTFFGSQDMFQRIYAARSQRDARHGLLLFTASLAVVGPTAVGLGIFGRAAFPGVGADGILLILTNGFVPPGLVSVILLGYLALANSDADSQLLTITSSLTHDFLPHFQEDLEERKQVWIDRLSVTVVGVMAVVLATIAPDLVSLLSGLGTLFAILGVAVIATLYWERTTDRAVFAGLVVGSISPLLVITLTGAHQVVPVAAMGTSAATVGLGSVLSRSTNRISFVSIR